MKILITGATGFIGSHLARRLIQNTSNEVYCLITPSDSLERLESLISRKPFCYLQKDLRSITPACFKDEYFDVIYHLAAYTNVMRHFNTSDKAIEINVMGTINLLHNWKLNYGRLVFTSTGEVYGNSQVPFRETDCINPVSPYSISKACAEQFCLLSHKLDKKDVVILRLFNVYGPGQKDNRFIAELVKRLINDKAVEMTLGQQTREFNYVEDIVEGIILAGNKPNIGGQIINLGNSIEYKLEDVANEIYSQIKRGDIHLGALPYRDNEIMRMFCDNTKAKELLGWHPKTSLKDGIKKTIEAYKREL